MSEEVEPFFDKALAGYEVTRDEALPRDVIVCRNRNASDIWGLAPSVLLINTKGSLIPALQRTLPFVLFALAELQKCPGIWEATQRRVSQWKGASS